MVQEAVEDGGRSRSVRQEVRPAWDAYADTSERSRNKSALLNTIRASIETMGKFDQTMRPDLIVHNEALAVNFTLTFPTSAEVNEIVDAQVIEPEPAPFSLDIDDAFPALPAPPTNGNGHFAEPGAIREAYIPGPKPNPSLRSALLLTILELCRGPQQHASLEEILLAHPDVETVEAEIASLSATGHLQSGSDESGRYWILTGLGKGIVGL